MKMSVLVVLAVLVGCAPPAPDPVAAAPPPAPPCTCPPVAPAAPAAPVAPSPAVRASRAYHDVEKSIAPAVTSPVASAGYIRAVEKADRLAREAQRLLVAQDGHPTTAAIEDARRTVEDLIRTLDTPQ
jgi:pyruvate/2-oxoglutarate dehydrogenase complex dihydrolipoamide acyltransferase (E2) component